TSIAINKRKSRDGVEKSSQAPLVSKIAAPSGMVASPRLPFWNLRPFSTEVTRTFACSSSDVIASLHRARWIERGGRHHIVHAVVEVLDSELRLIEREVGVLRILRDLGVAQPPHRAVGDHDRAKALESRAAERVVLRKQEVAAPESFARHRAVRL